MIDRIEQIARIVLILALLQLAFEGIVSLRAYRDSLDASYEVGTSSMILSRLTRR